MSSVASRPTDSSSGISLAIRLQGGKDGAWVELVELYGPLVQSWASSSGLRGAAAEDIAQEVFLSVHRSIHDFDAHVVNATFRGWLWRITRNAVLQRARKPNTCARGGSTAMTRLTEIADPIEPGFDEDEPPVSAEDTAGLLRRAMSQIESRVDRTTWQAFLHTVVLNQSSTEAATELGLTPAAVRKAKSRTLQKLRKQLGDLP